MENKKIKRLKRQREWLKTISEDKEGSLGRGVGFIKLGFTALSGVLLIAFSIANITIGIGLSLLLATCSTIDTIFEFMFKHGAEFCKLAAKECTKAIKKEEEIDMAFAYDLEKIHSQERELDVALENNVSKEEVEKQKLVLNIFQKL